MLGHDHAGHLVLVVQHQLAHAEHDRGALGQRHLGPLPLSAAGHLDGVVEVGVGGLQELPLDLPRARVLHREAPDGGALVVLAVDPVPNRLHSPLLTPLGCFCVSSSTAARGDAPAAHGEHMAFLPLCQHIVTKVRWEVAQWDDVGSARPPSGSVRPPSGSARPPSGSARPPSGSARPPSGSACRRQTSSGPSRPHAHPRTSYTPPGRTGRERKVRSRSGPRPVRRARRPPLQDRSRTPRRPALDRKGGSHALLRRLPPPNTERIGMIPRFHDAGRAVPAGKSAWEPPFSTSLHQGRPPGDRGEPTGRPCPAP